MRLSEAQFSNRFLAEIPEHEVYSKVHPEPVPEPRLLAWSEDLAYHFGLSHPLLNGDSPPRPGAPRPDLEILAGNRLPQNITPYAVRYGGHQFGRWAGQLGDGRAITLGELADRDGQTWEFQLKGSGQTPYSRRGDGKAVLRSSIREFVASEAMHYLRVPTTRSLSLVATGAQVLRDMFYDGNPKFEPGAITSRQAPTFLRFGNFEIHAAQDEKETLKKLIHWTIRRHFPQMDADSPDAVPVWFREVCERTARLMVEWLRVGFVHGVMNTDNMSILGLTIDYGPFGFLDSYEPEWTPNTTDLPGRRYCYGRQASIALWNCERLADALTVLSPDTAALEEGLKAFVYTYEKSFLKMMAGKLGLKDLKGDADLKLLGDLDQTLQSTPTDMTLFFRALSRGGDLRENISPALYETPDPESEGQIREWLKRYEHRLALENVLKPARKQMMENHNPWIIPRNYILFNVIQKAEQGDLGPLNELMAALKDPYTENPKYQYLAEKRPDWAKTQPGSSTLSCSS